MGIPSLVQRQYSTLGIKEIMHETQYHIVYTPISTLLPVSAKIATKSTTAQNTDLCESINEAIAYYEKAIRDLNVYVCQEYHIHNQMAGFMELKLDFQNVGM